MSSKRIIGFFQRGGYMYKLIYKLFDEILKYLVYNSSLITILTEMKHQTVTIIYIVKV